MQKRQHLAFAGIAALITLAAISPAGAGTTGRVSKFISPTTVGDSVLFESGGRIGLATTAPLAALDIRAPYALNLMGLRPFLTFRDTGAGNAMTAIQSVNGGLTLVGANTYSASNPYAFVQIDRAGRVGLGTRTPFRTLQIGPDTNALFTIDPSDASPNAGYVRFGDGTGWQLHFGRNRNGSGGPLTTGTTGVIMTIKDNSPSGIGGTVIFKGGVQVDSLYGSGASPTPVCRNSLNLLSYCSSSRRYKNDIKPFTGGLDLVNHLQPVSFTWNEDQHPDIGLIAEEVALVEPRLTFQNESGDVEGVRNDLLGTVLINAIKEQQAQIDRQQKLIAELQAVVARLEKAN